MTSAEWDGIARRARQSVWVRSAWVFGVAGERKGRYRCTRMFVAYWHAMGARAL